MQSDIEEIGQELHVAPGIGCLPRLGFLLGLGISLIAFVPVQQRGGAEWYKVLPVGLAILAASTYRRRIIIDLDAGHIFRRTKLVGYTRQTREQPLARFSHIALGHQWKRTKNGRHRVFYVSLSGDESFSIAEQSNIDTSRNLAEELARRLSLPIHDSSSGGVSVLATADIGTSLRGRILQEGQPEKPANPQTQTARVDTESNSLHITVPPPGYSLGNLALLLPMMAFGLFIMWIVKIGFEPDRDLDERVIAVLGTLFACAWILWPLAFYISHATRKVSITLNKTQLQFVAKTIFRSPSFAIDIEDVVDIFAFDLKKLGYRKREAVGEAGGVAIRSKDRTLRFGAHLPQDEQTYLCDLLRYWISQP